MEFLKDLLNSTLLPFALVVAIFLQVAKNLWTNAIRGEFPKWGDLVLAIVSLFVSFFLVSTWARYLPASETPSITTDVWLQTFILWLGTVFSHFVLKATYGQGRPVATADDLRAIVGKADPEVVAKAGVSVTDYKPLAILVGLVLAAALLASPAVAGPPVQKLRNGVMVTEPDSSVLATWRLAGYVKAQAAQFENVRDEKFSSFLPGAGISYTWTPELSTSVNVEGDVASKILLGYAGARLLTYSSDGAAPLDVYVGVDYRWANEDALEILGLAENTGLELSVRAAVPLLLRKDGTPGMFIDGSYRWGPGEKVPALDDLEQKARDSHMLTIGIRPVVFGGHW